MVTSVNFGAFLFDFMAPKVLKYELGKLDNILKFNRYKSYFPCQSHSLCYHHERALYADDVELCLEVVPLWLADLQFKLRDRHIWREIKEYKQVNTWTSRMWSKRTNGRGRGNSTKQLIIFHKMKDQMEYIVIRINLSITFQKLLKNLEPFFKIIYYLQWGYGVQMIMNIKKCKKEIFRQSFCLRQM